MIIKELRQSAGYTASFLSASQQQVKIVSAPENLYIYVEEAPEAISYRRG